MAEEFDGAVLCGGASRRMGRDKATIEIDGAPMFQRVAEAMKEAGAVTTTAVGGSVEVEGAAHNIADRWPGEGPLGGIITALGAAGSTPVVAVLSCDLLAPDSDVIATLVERRAAEDGDVAVATVDGVEQWTLAVWHRRSIDRLSEHFIEGERAIRRAVDDLDVVRVDVPEVSAADADRPEDLP